MDTKEQFPFDVFLSHSAKDREVVREIAERLRADGLKVWFDDWVLKPGDGIPARIEEGLERSRVLVLCMSAHAFGSDWTQLEATTFRFRDPQNKERRFIPLRLDEAPIKGSLAQFLYVEWLPAGRDKEYAKLLKACRPLEAIETASGGVWNGPIRAIQVDLKVRISAYAFSSDARYVLTGGADKSIRLWEMETGRCLRVLRCHRKPVQDIEWSQDQRRALVWTDGDNVRLLDVENDKVLVDYGKTLLTKRQMDCFRLLAGGLSSFEIQRQLQLDVMTVGTHLQELRKRLSVGTRNEVRDIATRFYGRGRHPTFPPLKVHPLWIPLLAWSVERERALSRDEQNYRHLRLCTKFGGGGHAFAADVEPNTRALAWRNDRRRAATGSENGVIRLWDVLEGKCVRILEGRGGRVDSLAWHPNQRFLLAGTKGGVVAFWDTEIGQCLYEIHSSAPDNIERVMWSADGCYAFVGTDVGGITGWRMPQPSIKKRTPMVAVPLLSPEPDQVQYTNAKVLLVGDSGVGKSGLSNYLAHRVTVEDDKPLPSTDGAWATHWPLSHTNQKTGVQREIWLWDFAGQVDYRLVHQLYMDDTAAAVLVFNPQNENPFDGLGHWDLDLRKAARKPFVRLLAAGRVDRGGLVVSASNMKKFMAERGFLAPLHLTSAKTGEGCDELREAIVQAIDWRSIPETTSPALYHRMKQEILSLRDQNFVLMRLAELKQRMKMTLGGEAFDLPELDAVVSLLAGPGMIQRLDFGGFILLRPEVLSRYAAAVVRKVRKHPHEMGCIREDELLSGDLDYQDFKRLPHDDEAVVLRALLETFVSRAWCLRQPCDGTALLTFPSYFRRERMEQPSHPSVLVTYRFDGPTDDIYATLVVRLHHTLAFPNPQLWKSAADFKTQTGAALGFTLARETEGTSRLEVYFEPDVDPNSQVLFLRYVHDHLNEHAQNVVRLRHYSCANVKCKRFNQSFSDREAIDEALSSGKRAKVYCPGCGKPISLRDVIEEKFDSPAVKELVREMQVEGQALIDNESRELMAVYHTGFTVAEAGQVFRPTTNSDHGIDGEIEFKDSHGHASGQRLYVQLKSGDSYLRKRRRDGAEIFQIKNPRWADYWQQQAYAVMLVIRTSDGEIRWMDVSAYLKRECAGGRTVRQIVFEGERLDVMSVQRWRTTLLANST